MILSKAASCTPSPRVPVSLLTLKTVRSTEIGSTPDWRDRDEIRDVVSQREGEAAAVWRCSRSQKASLVPLSPHYKHPQLLTQAGPSWCDFSEGERSDCLPFVGHRPAPKLVVSLGVAPFLPFAPSVAAPFPGPHPLLGSLVFSPWNYCPFVTRFTAFRSLGTNYQQWGLSQFKQWPRQRACGTMKHHPLRDLAWIGVTELPGEQWWAALECDIPCTKMNFKGFIFQVNRRPRPWLDKASWVMDRRWGVGATVGSQGWSQ